MYTQLIIFEVNIWIMLFRLSCWLPFPFQNWDHGQAITLNNQIQAVRVLQLQEWWSLLVQLIWTKMKVRCCLKFLKFLSFWNFLQPSIKYYASTGFMFLIYFNISHTTRSVIFNCILQGVMWPSSSLIIISISTTIAIIIKYKWQELKWKESAWK